MSMKVKSIIYNYMNACLPPLSYSIAHRNSVQPIAKREPIAKRDFQPYQKKIYTHKAAQTKKQPWVGNGIVKLSTADTAIVPQ